MESGRRNTHLEALRANREWEALRSVLRYLPNHCLLGSGGRMALGMLRILLARRAPIDSERGQKWPPPPLGLGRKFTSATASSRAVRAILYSRNLTCLSLRCSVYSGPSWLHVNALVSLFTGSIVKRHLMNILLPGPRAYNAYSPSSSSTSLGLTAQALQQSLVSVRYEHASVRSITLVPPMKIPMGRV